MWKLSDFEFKVGDMVKVKDPMKPSSLEHWEEMAGRVGKVTNVTPGKVTVVFVSSPWYYLPSELKHVQPCKPSPVDAAPTFKVGDTVRPKTPGSRGYYGGIYGETLGEVLEVSGSMIRVNFPWLGGWAARPDELILVQEQCPYKVGDRVKPVSVDSCCKYGGNYGDWEGKVVEICSPNKVVVTWDNPDPFRWACDVNELKLLPPKVLNPSIDIKGFDGTLKVGVVKGEHEGWGHDHIGVTNESGELLYVIHISPARLRTGSRKPTLINLS